MATKIRLQRFGRKGRAYYHIVVADSRAKRDGRFIERLGSYDPNKELHHIDLNFDKAVDWLMKGAQPSDTARSILKKKGVLLKKHLLGGVKKGALTEEKAEEKFNEWLKTKDSELDSSLKKLEADKAKQKEENLKRESEKNQQRLKAIQEEEAKRIEGLKQEVNEEVAEGEEETNEENTTPEATDTSAEIKPEEEAPKTEDSAQN